MGRETIKQLQNIFSPPRRFESQALEAASLRDYCERFSDHRHAPPMCLNEDQDRQRPNPMPNSSGDVLARRTTQLQHEFGLNCVAIGKGI